ncbi:MAG: GntR family transcriptional regulator [Acidimicrobiia bacterium]|nr:GntR family transcriptional regulator [Acidimicrobiia bacterium]
MTPPPEDVGLCPTATDDAVTAASVVPGDRPPPAPRAATRPVRGRPRRPVASTGLAPPSTPAARRRADPARRVRDLLWTAMREDLVPTAPLPPEEQLAREYQVSRNAMRAALASLRDDGLVARVQGAGTFGAGEGVVHACDRLGGFEDSLEAGPARVTYEILAATELTPPRLLAQLLELGADESVVLVERLSRVDGAPACLRCHWLPGRMAAILELDLRRPFYDLLEDGLGIEVGEATMFIDAVGADGGTASLLDVADGAPLLYVENHTASAEGRPLQVSYARARGDRAALITRASRPPRQR